MHWQPEQALEADVNAIEVAFRGHRKMLEAIFGPPGKASPDKVDWVDTVYCPKEPPKDAHGNPIVLTADLFDTLFGEGKVGSNRRKLPPQMRN